MKKKRKTTTKIKVPMKLISVKQFGRKVKSKPIKERRELSKAFIKERKKELVKQRDEKIKKEIYKVDKKEFVKGEVRRIAGNIEKGLAKPMQNKRILKKQKQATLVLNLK